MNHIGPDDYFIYKGVLCRCFHLKEPHHLVTRFYGEMTTICIVECTRIDASHHIILDKEKTLAKANFDNTVSITFKL
jgi:hypothetical protein